MKELKVSYINIKEVGDFYKTVDYDCYPYDTFEKINMIGKILIQYDIDDVDFKSTENYIQIAKYPKNGMDEDDVRDMCYLGFDVDVKSKCIILKNKSKWVIWKRK